MLACSHLTKETRHMLRHFPMAAVRRVSSWLELKTHAITPPALFPTLSVCYLLRQERRHPLQRRREELICFYISNAIPKGTTQESL